MNGIVKARDTIRGCPELEQTVEIPRELMEILESTKREINCYGVAIIPYCMKCKRSLDWDFDKLNIFCPRCGRVFIYPFKEVSSNE